MKEVSAAGFMSATILGGQWLCPPGSVAPWYEITFKKVFTLPGINDSTTFRSSTIAPLRSDYTVWLLCYNSSSTITPLCYDRSAPLQSPHYDRSATLRLLRWSSRYDRSASLRLLHYNRSATIAPLRSLCYAPLCWSSRYNVYKFYQDVIYLYLCQSHKVSWLFSSLLCPVYLCFIMGLGLIQVIELSSSCKLHGA